MRLTAAQPGPWLRPVNLQPLSEQNNTDQAKPRDILPTQEDHETDKNEFRSQYPPPNKEEALSLPNVFNIKQLIRHTRDTP